MKELELHRQLIEDCKKGNRKAQYQFYRMYSKAMYNICLRMTRDKLDAEDLLQNSFIDVFNHLESFNFHSTPGAWIKRIVINNCINFLKKKRNFYEEIPEYKLEESDDEELDIKINVKLINKSMEKLPDGYRIVFTLYLLEGYDHKEISSILEISESTSKSQYSRAKKKLKEIILSDKESKLIL